jgi:glycosyltransferase involved in cell wall biosynthesis
MTKLLFFISTMGVGGSERVMANLCNKLSERGYDVHLAFDTNEHIAYKLNNKLTIIELPTPKSNNILSRLYHSCKKKRGIIKQIKPDVIIAFHYIGLSVSFSAFGLQIPVIISYRTTLDRKMSVANRFKSLYLIRMANKVTLMTKHDFDFVGKRIPSKVVMYNPLSYEIFQGNNIRKKNILCVGGYNSWKIKGFDTMIKIWGKLAPLFEDWTLDIITSMPAEDIEYLIGLTKECRVEQRTNFSGFRKDIDKIMQASSIFVLPSRFEGMPNTLLEAMSQGCCCIAFDCKTGPREIITDQVSGVLVQDQDEEEMTNALTIVMKDESLREQLSIKAREEIKRFDLNTIVDKWERLFEELLQKNNSVKS